jgi:hypothetical protein
MDTAPTDPGLAVDPAPACPKCGGGCVGDATTLVCAALADVVGAGQVLARRLQRKFETADDVGSGDVADYDRLARAVRRTAALYRNFSEDSQKTPEQRAAEQLRREAAQDRRAEAAEQARLTAKRERVQQGAAAIVRRESEPSDREDLLSDLRERLLYPDIEDALPDQDVTTLVMRVLHDLGIAPRAEMWSAALMAHEARATHAELRRLEAERAAGEAAMAAGKDWQEGVEFTPPPGVVQKRGRFTFGPDGSVIAEEKWDVPQSEWPPDIVGGRDPPDTG